MKINKLGELEKTIVQHSSGSFPVIVLDTGGLIDIANAIRIYNVNYRNKTISPIHKSTITFLKYLSEKTPIVITLKTYQEIKDHGRMWLNGHTLELFPETVDFALDIMNRSKQFCSGLDSGIEPDQARYDAHWASIEACNGNSKKSLEGCSDTDKEILSTVAYLSTSKIPGATIKKIGPVLVISPDLHIIRGTEFLKRGFDDRYSNVVPISTRH